jgi:hypothetical protein
MTEPEANTSPKAKEDHAINKDMIKPKHIKTDKRVFYKSSIYVRDLLGEGK